MFNFLKKAVEKEGVDIESEVLVGNGSENNIQDTELGEEVEELQEDEVLYPQKSKEEILALITHPNRREVAVDILGGMCQEDLNKKWGNITVQEMQRTINKLNGNHWVCKMCNR